MIQEILIFGYNEYAKEITSNFVADKFSVKVKLVTLPKDSLKLESGDTIFNFDKWHKIMNYEFNHSVSEWLKSI